MFIRIIFILLIPAMALAQASEVVKQTYPNGSVSEKWLIISAGDYTSLKYYPNGVLMDSTTYQNDAPHGPAKHFFESGKLEYVVNYFPGNYYTFTKYRQNGTMRLQAGSRNNKTFGICMAYNKHGKLVERDDFNKGKLVAVQEKYNSCKHLKALPYYDRIKKRKKITLLNSNHNTRKLKRHALAYLKFAGSDSVYSHCLVSGFVGDTLVLSKFSYDLSNDHNTLQFDSVFLAPLSKITGVYFLKNNYDAKQVWGALLASYGSFAVISSLGLVPALTGGQSFSEPYTYAFLSTGIAAFWIGRSMAKALNTKSYTTLKYKAAGK